ncbi:histidinolphosphatase [Pseudocyphellaria aurata]|nr:histidinolphosphatase [Pseudocyphellaria aurata]
MPFSHHSHSGQFCSHGKNTLEEIVQGAIKRKMQVLALTEHMPREQDDLYPEEIEALQTQDTLVELFDAYVTEAARLQTKYAPEIEIFIGLEIDWIRPSSMRWIHSLLEMRRFDLFIGSIHHVHTIPIDYNREMYVEARGRSGGTDKQLFEDYFDLQLEMLRALRPPVVGHFDLIRLKSDDPNADCLRWDDVRQKISRNLDFIISYGGLLELSSAALRKGLSEPYPAKSICQMYITKGGQFTVSDDCHSVGQIGANYSQLLEFAKETGIETWNYLKRNSFSNDVGYSNTQFSSICIAEVEDHQFFKEEPLPVYLLQSLDARP